MRDMPLVRVGSLMLLLVFGSGVGWISSSISLATPTSSDVTGAPRIPTYKAPRASSPRARIGGHPRGSDRDAPHLIALVPDHIGFTLKSNPSLCWYLSQSTTRPVQFTILDSRGIRPLVEQPLSSPTHPGFQCISLHDYGIDLKEQEPYRWFVTLVLDPSRPSRDVVAGGMIERVAFDEACALGMPCSKAACDREAVYQYAESGLWYDAVGCLMELMQHNGDSPFLQPLLKGMLGQVGIYLPDGVGSLSK
jgi:hypothetical protein